MSRPTDPWHVREDALDPERAAAQASVLALANGHLGVRGLLDEGQPGAGPGTLLASAHEEHPFTYAEPAFGYPDTDERIVPVADGWTVRLLVDGVPLDTTTGCLHRHERTLDLRAGVLDRAVTWTSPSGPTVQVTSRRLVSLVRPELAAVEYEVHAVDGVHVELQPFRCTASPAPDGTTGTGSGERTPPHASDDEDPAVLTQACEHGTGRSWSRELVPTTGTHVLVVADHAVTAPDGVEVQASASGHTTGFAATLAAGQSVRLQLAVAHVAAAGVPPHELEAQAARVLDAAGSAGWERLQDEQRAFLDDVWARCDVEVDGDPELQQAVRFALFQVVQSAACLRVAGVRAKGLTGDGYHGHTFWDVDTFVLPVLTQLLPHAAAAHVRWRHSTLPTAVERARVLHLDGAAHPWRTITGPECSGYWPAGSAAVHVNAAVADAAVRHLTATGDDEFGRRVALDLVTHAARFWVALGHHERGEFHLDGVTGPDEYSALGDDNAYTNLMAQRNLRDAVALVGRYADEPAARDVTRQELDRWTRAADEMAVPRDPLTGITEQSAGYLRREVWDFDAWDAKQYPLDDNAPYEALYRHQVVKQADLVLALYLAGDAFTADQKRRDFDHYETLTVRDSSLSAPAQAVVAAEVGHLDLAYSYTRETALIDLDDLHGSAADGLHVAALAGAWTALVAGFGGLREVDGRLHLSPRLPRRLTRLRFRVAWRGSLVDVEVVPGTATYRLLQGPSIDLVHDAEPVRLTADEPTQRRATGPLPSASDPPRQPPGREPLA